MSITDWYKVPTGYNCLDVSNNNFIYAYTGNRRDTYRLNGMIWTKTGQSTSSSSYNCSSMQVFSFTGSHFVPYDQMGFIILSSTIVVLAFFSVILNWFKGVANHV